MTEKRYFTAPEIDLLIPQLERIFSHIETCKARAEELAAQTLGKGDASLIKDVAQSQVLRSQVEFLLGAVEEDIKEIQKMGGLTKDLDLGLVDFLGDVGGRDVWLCWRRG